MLTFRGKLYLCLLFLLCLIYSSSARATAHEDTDHDHDHNGHDDSHEHHQLRMSNDTNATNGTQGDQRSVWEPYVYGTLSVAFVSLLSIVGVVVIPVIKSKLAYDAVMLTFMALAVGTMTSDALLHLIPEALGMHDHGHGDGDGHDHDHDHDEAKDEHAYLGKIVALLGTLYALHILELMMHTAANLWKTKKTKVAQIEKDKNGATVIKVGGPSETKDQPGEAKWTSPALQGGHGHSHMPVISEDEEGHSTILGLKTYAFVVVLSDAMHNFTDGLAIGAAFSTSSAAGLGVSIAVVCHEIPHEMGNFAILLNSGMGLKKALLLNFLSAVTCFAGLYPGIVAGQQETLSQWIFAAVAAGFLYVALVHMSRELQNFNSLPWYLNFILQNLGMLIGFVVIYLLAIYEENLSSMG